MTFRIAFQSALRQSRNRSPQSQFPNSQSRTPNPNISNPKSQISNPESSPQRGQVAGIIHRANGDPPVRDGQVRKPAVVGGKRPETLLGHTETMREDGADRSVMSDDDEAGIASRRERCKCGTYARRHDFRRLALRHHGAERVGSKTPT